MKRATGSETVVPPLSHIIREHFPPSGSARYLIRGATILTALAIVSACAGRQTTQPETSTAVTVEVTPQIVPDPVGAKPETRTATAEPSVMQSDLEPPAPATDPVPKPVEVAAAPVPEGKPAQPVQTVLEAPTPVTRPETSVEVLEVTEKPAATSQTVEVVETEDEVLVRSETTTKTDRIVDRVTVEPNTGRVTEEVAVIETTQRDVDTVVVDKDTGAVVETVEVGRPTEQVLEAARLEIAPEKPRDPRRLFAGPEQYPPRDYGAYAIMAIRADAPASDRDRIRMICDAFIAADALENEGELAPSASMVSVWPVSSAQEAEDLNRTTSRADICMEAINRYGLATAHRAIIDTEKTGWILDNPGPYILAWAPGSAKGEIDARVLVLDLTTVTQPDQATELMESWSRLERDPDLRNAAGWDTPVMQKRIGEWRQRHGRNLMLLGPVEG